MKSIFTLILCLVFSAFATSQTTPCNLSASFVASPANVPLTYHFQNTTTPLANTDSIRWSFGDGTFSNEINPDHTYPTAGTYVVCLRVIQRTPGTTFNCSSEFCQTIVLQPATTCNLVVNFTATQTSLANTFHFENTTVPLSATDSVRWAFGDGTFSNAVSPNHTYTAPGTYNVCLRVQQRTPNGTLSNCVRDVCHTIIVQQPNTCNLVVSFTVTQTTLSPNTFHFENTTVPLNNTDSIRWSFGDGTFSNTVSPNHTYTAPGVYTVCLRVQQRNSAGTLSNCVREICNTVTVASPPTCNLVVNFVATQTSAANTFHFENTSVPLNNTDSILWSFGDGTFSNAVSPNHSYATPGTYTVCLKVIQRNTPGTSSNCTREVCHTIIVPQPPACNLVVNFTASQVTSAPNTIHFENTTVPLNNTDSIRWSFGDGTFSSAVSPNHTYALPGTYNVCLWVQQRNASGTPVNCTREICHTVVVQQTNTCNLVVNFTSTQLASAPNTFHFENTTVPLNNTDSIRWSFGDGTFSNAVSPNHTYSSPGTYNVCLRVQQRTPNGTLTNCVRDVCHTITVQQPNTCNLVVNFTITPTSLLNSYHFENTSVPLNSTDSIRWSFGDGTFSNAVSPNHTYSSPGTYNVCLRVQQRNAAGTPSNCVREICHTLVVTPTCNLQANFSWNADPANPRLIHFINQTVTPTTASTALWSFGDGTTSTAWNPVHDYAQPGRYYVCLRVQSGPNCISEYCDSVTVRAPLPDCSQLSQFTFTGITATNQAFVFTPAVLNTTWQYSWTFGDGTGSQSPQVTHQYALPGIYTVCLTISTPNCTSTTCHQVNAGYVNCANVLVNYSYRRDPVVLNKFYFQANSNYPITDQVWRISKVSSGTVNTPPVILNQNNPAYTFSDTGHYRVCLRATTIGGCIKEYCEVIYVGRVNTPGACALVVYPNPVTNVANVNVFLNQPQMIDIYVYNAQSVLVREKHQQGVAGTNIVSILVGNLPSGIYGMKIIYGNNICHAQFVKN